jgi:hypothetical protein
MTVILSEVTGSRSEAVMQSKDPLQLNSVTDKYRRSLIAELGAR